MAAPESEHAVALAALSEPLEPRKGGRLTRWWRRVFALDPPEADVEAEAEADAAAVAATTPALATPPADPIPAADEYDPEPMPALDEYMPDAAAPADEEAFAAAWAGQPVPGAELPDDDAPEVTGDEAEVDEWLAFAVADDEHPPTVEDAEAEPDQPPAPVGPGASWPADPIALAHAGRQQEPDLLDDVPPLPEWAEAELGDDSEPQPGIPDEPVPVLATGHPDDGDDDDDEEFRLDLDTAANDDDEDEFRLQEISEEHYYLQATTQEHVGLAASVEQAAAERAEQQAVAAAIPGLETGVVGFEDVADSAYDAEDEEDAEIAVAAARRSSELALRVVTGVVLAGAFLLSLWLSPTALSVLAVIVVLVALGEFYAVMLKAGYQPLTLFGLVGGAVALLGGRVWGEIAVPGALLLTATLVFFYYAMSPHRRAPLLNGAVTITGVAWVTGFAAFLMPILDSEDYRVLVFAVVMITVFMDIGSYFTGRSRGRHKLAPVISPGKTVEGLVGGAIFAIGIGAAIGQLEPLDTVSGIVLGAAIAAVSPLGDLSVSMLKRALGIKDMSGILPGHGGLLDRVDALIFAIPTGWLVFSWLGLLG